jgi:hypothetical protein
MRFVLILTLVAVLMPVAGAQDQVSEEVVKAVRAAISEKREERQVALIDSVLSRKDLDWKSFRKGLQDGPYYQKPLVTGYGARHSGKHFNLRLRGDDDKERGFSIWVPKAYDAKTPLPAIFYIHHGARVPHPPMGAERAGTALFRFRDICDKHGIFFIAPYTCAGAEWWTPEGRRLVEWTLDRVKRRYSLDEDRIALMGSLDGGDAVWYLGQEMPGTWSALMPMTGDPYEISALIRPLYLGTLDRMDVLMGVPGKTKSTVGEKDHNAMLGGLKPFFGQRMRVTTAVFPTSQADFAYLEHIREQVASFTLDRKRKALAVEVDIETDHDDGLRSLWLRNDGWDPDGETAHNFPTTRLKWDAPGYKDPDKKIGIGLQKRGEWPVGLMVNNVGGATRDANVFVRDVLLEVDGVPVKEVKEVGPIIKKHEWDEEIHLLLAREVKADHMERAVKREAHYMKVRRKIEELRAAGKPIPDDIDSMVEEEESAEEEEEEDEGDEPTIEFGDDDDDDGGNKPGAGAGAGAGSDAEDEKTEILIFQRWVKIRKPVGALVRRDFGLNMDRSFEKKGVKIGHVYPGSRADRAGFKQGDVIVQVGADEVENAYDIVDYFKDFKFEKEPEGERFVEFTVRKQNEHGTWSAPRTVKATWEPRFGTRVDARWNKKEKTLNVITRKCSGFTVYFTGEYVQPGEEFHLFINNVPYLDLIDPATAPKYPQMRMGTDAAVRDRVYRMRRKRAKVEGWQPDYRLAMNDYLKHRDRKLIVGAKRSFDLTKMKEGFAGSKKRQGGRAGKKGQRIKKAYEEYKSRG